MENIECFHFEEDLRQDKLVGKCGKITRINNEGELTAGVWRRLRDMIMVKQIIRIDSYDFRI